MKQMKRWGEDAPIDPEEEDDTTELASILMTRLLFLMYGDDAGLWEQDLFYRWVESVNSKNIGPALDGLFEILNTDETTRRRKYRNNLPDLEARFPYVNGGIFDSQVGYSVPPEFKDALLDASRFRWTSISPAIFGSMFQLVKSKEARRGDGEHYTSETNILKTIGPLFLDEYRDRAVRLIANKSTSVADLRRFQEELAANIYVDPACGAGNFLNVAYAKLREIETDIIVERRKRSGAGTGSLDISFDQLLTIDKFYGIEINWWPAKIAETAMFLVDHQANRHLAAKIGEAPDRLPIEITATIIHDNALQLHWPEIFPKPAGTTFIFGNPPFIGQYTKTAEQTADMRTVWGQDYNGYLDYVTGWHAKSKDLLKERLGEFAFVTTNSITQGQPVPALFGPLYREGWKIKFAHRTFAWDSEAPGKAAVHCVIIGFTKYPPRKPALWDYPDVKGEPHAVPVSNGINAYLLDAPNLLIMRRSKPLSPQLPRIYFGAKPTDGGHLIVEADEYDTVAADPIAAKYLRPFRMGRELVQGLDRWCLWMAGDDFDPKDISRSPILRQRVEAVREYRLQSKKKATREAADTPYLFQEVRHSDTAYVGIPAVVSETRRYYTVQHLSPEVIAGNKIYTAVDPDGLLFGLISSSMFITWQKAVGGRLESRLNFANTLTWNTFPVPELDSSTQAQVIEGGQKVLQARAKHPDRSLAVHYDPLAMSADLIQAHNKLDTAVDKAFKASRRLSTERQRLEVLFRWYEQLSNEESS